MNSTCMQQQEGILETTLNGKERIPKDFSQYIILIKLKKKAKWTEYHFCIYALGIEQKWKIKNVVKKI